MPRRKPSEIALIVLFIIMFFTTGASIVLRTMMHFGWM